MLRNRKLFLSIRTEPIKSKFIRQFKAFMCTGNSRGGLLTRSDNAPVNVNPRLPNLRTQDYAGIGHKCCAAIGWALVLFGAFVLWYFGGIRLDLKTTDHFCVRSNSNAVQVNCEMFHLLVETIPFYSSWRT